MEKKKQKNKVIIISVVASVLVHGLFLLSKLEFPPTSKNLTLKKEEKLRVVFKRRKSSKSKAKQLVNDSESGRKEKAKDAKYLGRTDQAYDRQTTSKKIGAFKEAGKGRKDGVTKRVSKHNPKKRKRKEEKKKSVVKKVIRKLKNKRIALKDLAAPIKHAEAQRSASKELPSMAALGLENGINQKNGLSRNNDYLEEIPLGDMTRLNTIEYKYYGFYHRIRQRLEQHWGSTLQTQIEKLYRKGRRLPSSKNRITSLIVTIDTRGRIIDVHVKGSSGVSELDAAAVDSFNKAGPFPNPPQGMMTNGLAEIEWGFVVKS